MLQLSRFYSNSHEPTGFRFSILSHSLQVYLKTLNPKPECVGALVLQELRFPRFSTRG